jgi:hypothetical protein
VADDQPHDPPEKRASVISAIVMPR